MSYRGPVGLRRLPVQQILDGEIAQPVRVHPFVHELSEARHGLHGYVRMFAERYDPAHLASGCGGYRDDDEVGAGPSDDLGDPSTVAENAKTPNFTSDLHRVVVDEAEGTIAAGGLAQQGAREHLTGLSRTPR